MKKSLKHGLEMKIEKQLNKIQVEKELNEEEGNKLKRRLTRKQQRFARTVEKYHKPNPKIMRLRELNR